MKKNKQKRGPIVIDMNIHPSLAIKIEDKKILPVRDSNSHMIPSKLLSVAAQLTELRRKLDITNLLYLYLIRKMCTITTCFPFHVLQSGIVRSLIIQRSKSTYTFIYLKIFVRHCYKQKVSTNTSV